MHLVLVFILEVHSATIGYLLVYVIGLHAVQFGNNWMKKIPRTAKIGRGRRPNPIWLSEEFFESNNWIQKIPLTAKLDSAKLDKHVVLFLINYIASQLLGIAQS